MPKIPNKIQHSTSNLVETMTIFMRIVFACFDNSCDPVTKIGIHYFNDCAPFHVTLLNYTLTANTRW